MAYALIAACVFGANAGRYFMYMKSGVTASKAAHQVSGTRQLLCSSSMTCAHALLFFLFTAPQCTQAKLAEPFIPIFCPMARARSPLAH